MKKTLFATLAVLIASVAAAQVYQYYGPANGVQYNNGNSYQNTAATASQIAATYTGQSGCSGIAVLGFDGNCHTIGTFTSANPSATIGLTAVNGTATTYMTSDSAPPLSQTISPTMTGSWNFSPSAAGNGLTVSPQSGSNGVVVLGPSGATGNVVVTGNAGASSQGFIFAQNSSGGGVINDKNTAGLIIQTNTLTALTISGTDQGITIGSPTGGDKGAGTINATGLYINGTAVAAGGAPGGASTDIQYNNGGAFGGASNFTYNNGNGAVVIATPSAATFALTVDGFAGTYAAQIVGSSTSGQSYGLRSQAGTTSADQAFIVQNQAATATYFEIFGDGSGTLRPSSSLGLSWATTGALTIAAPSSGSNAMTINAVANSFAARLNGAATSGQSNGMQIVAGTTSGDLALDIRNHAVTANLFQVWGDSHFNLGPTLTGTAAGNISIAAPTSGIDLTANGFAGSPIVKLTSGSSATSATNDLEVDRAGSTANNAGEGPNIVLNDTTNTTDALIEEAGGQFEFWHFNGSWVQAMYFATNNGLVVGSATGGTKGAGTVNATGLYVNGTAVGTAIAPCIIRAQFSGTTPSVAASSGCSSASVSRSSTGAYTFTDANITGFTASCIANSSSGGPFVQIITSVGGGSGGIDNFAVPGSSATVLADIPSGASLICTFPR